MPFWSKHNEVPRGDIRAQIAAKRTFDDRFGLRNTEFKRLYNEIVNDEALDLHGLDLDGLNRLEQKIGLALQLFDDFQGDLAAEVKRTPYFLEALPGFPTLYDSKVEDLRRALHLVHNHQEVRFGKGQ